MSRPEISEPFVTDGMNLPKEIVYTGDAELLEEYLGNPEKHPLNEKAKKHLRDRLENVRYVNEIANANAGVKYKPLDAVETENGFILTGIHQPERQETGHCCWTMPAKLMLQSRNINLEQETIRCYKPEIRLGAQQLDELDDATVREFTRNVNGNIKNLSCLMHKLVPNAAMVQISYMVPYAVKTDPDAQAENEMFRRNFKEQVTSALRDHRSPVALLKNGHYRTIVGIDGDDLIVKDSLSAVHGPDSDYKVSIASLFASPLDQTEITYMRDLTVTDGEKLPDGLRAFENAVRPGQGADKGKLVFSDAMNVIVNDKDITEKTIENPDGSTVSLGGGVRLPRFL